MPQFDFFAWASISFWTVLSFHIFYLFTLRFILSPFSEYQKIQQKISSKIKYFGKQYEFKAFVILTYIKFLKKKI